MFTFFIILILIAIFAYIVDDNSGTNKPTTSKKVSKKIFFEPEPIRKNQFFTYQARRLFDADSNPEVGEKVNLWKQPQTNIVNIYSKGGFMGSGLIGEIENRTIAEHIGNKDPYEATIVEADGHVLTLRIILETSFPSIDGFSQLQKTKWISEISKPYNPKSEWDLYFIMKPEFNPKSNVELKSNCIEEIDLVDFNDNIWLEDLEGNKLTVTNKSGSAMTVRTLRAIHSNYDLKIKYLHNKLGYASFSATPIKS